MKYEPIQPGTPCKEWSKARSRAGYGQFRRKGITYYSHRAAWEREFGPIPNGMWVCHKCDNPACYEITHLFLGTPKDNSQDMAGKGRSSRQLGELSPRARLTTKQVTILRERRAAGAMVKDLAREVGYHSAALSRVLRGLRHGDAA